MNVKSAMEIFEGLTREEQLESLAVQLGTTGEPS